MKTKEELNALKEEVEAVNEKLRELSEDELKQVTGGVSRKAVYRQMYEIGMSVHVEDDGISKRTTKLTYMSE